MAALFLSPENANVLVWKAPMDHSAEESFVKSFIRKDRRERLLLQLSSPKKRREGLDRFCHHAQDLIDPAKIVMHGEDLDRNPAFLSFVSAHGGQCLVLSPDYRPDGEYMPFADAVEAAVPCFDAVLILGEGFAVVFGEVMKGGRGKFLLAEKT